MPDTRTCKHEWRQANLGATYQRDCLKCGKTQWQAAANFDAENEERWEDIPPVTQRRTPEGPLL